MKDVKNAINDFTDSNQGSIYFTIRDIVDRAICVTRPNIDDDDIRRHVVALCTALAVNYSEGKMSTLRMVLERLALLYDIDEPIIDVILEDIKSYGFKKLIKTTND